MDPLPKWESALTSASSQVTIVQPSQNGSAPAHLIALEQLRIGLRSLTPTPGSSTPTSLAEGMLQQQYVEPKSLLEHRWGRLGFPQKKAFLGKLRRRHRDHRSPYPVDRDTRIFRSGNKTQNWFRCECLYCQARGQSISGERDGSTNASSWDTLVQGLGGLTLNLGADRPGLLPEGAQQQQQHLQMQQQHLQMQQQHLQMQQQPPLLAHQEPEGRCQQESKGRFQRLFNEWFEEN
ncbi:protein FAM156A/FAM156B-like [Chionomys nivalis]|uniref:protein FAM156A/FAM156B-like n=1 Tax=Chionomys nivalis TaxID=269649 RepID=UPI002594C825|nr:protein FAM156A/FAM156B-like [Chionomys nivalis]XP_057615753.1 protein FAM156A/FAM156B-like [Chionomys nivalis]XP_057615754.1 protein FAM156A/FAM156B-like [Chionomys nivalis]XP_057615755.1 protein FAM156A/FAM156B-like [Chionomys nivalis]XP_057615756.1 protein FAM156A/FAM156B-like [Chionomys nivalis]XP_057615757.1 protein FAM156A/FAM156B-like [Chionomys nivalis]XP_057615758.1 protein FAM156A/FAM156B-like [Chionomys nivalis]XP_057615759.1 protein FAM156A/FAM156B-like [Chionomys nivalis]XP_